MTGQTNETPFLSKWHYYKSFHSLSWKTNNSHLQKPTTPKFNVVNQRTVYIVKIGHMALCLTNERRERGRACRGEKFIVKEIQNRFSFDFVIKKGYKEVHSWDFVEDYRLRPASNISVYSKKFCRKDTIL